MLAESTADNVQADARAPQAQLTAERAEASAEQASFQQEVEARMFQLQHANSEVTRLQADNTRQEEFHRARARERVRTRVRKQADHYQRFLDAQAGEIVHALSGNNNKAEGAR